ncbi:hypothetical protein N7497_002004, partial [Penicillium chrysogenum]
IFSPLFLFFRFSSFATPFLYNSFVSFVSVIVRLYFLARHAHFVRASIPRCSLSRSDRLRLVNPSAPLSISPCLKRRRDTHTASPPFPPVRIFFGQRKTSRHNIWGWS